MLTFQVVQLITVSNPVVIGVIVKGRAVNLAGSSFAVVGNGVEIGATAIAFLRDAPRVIIGKLTI